MATIKSTIRKSRTNKDGDHPIYIRITHDRKSTEYSLHKYVAADYWDVSKADKRIKRKHPNATIWNIQINTVTNELTQISDRLTLSGELFTAKSLLKTYLDSKDSTSSINNNTSLIEYITHFIKTNPNNLTQSTLQNYSKLRSDLKLFLPSFKASALNEAFAITYQQYLVDKGLATNTILSRMKDLRKISFVLLRKGIISKYPFANYKDFKLKTNDTQRAFLTKLEFQKLLAYVPSTDFEGLVKDVFCFSCLTGLRFSDLCTIKSTNVQKIDNDNNYRLYFRMFKTETVISNKLPTLAVELVLKYQNDYIFPILDTRYNLNDESILYKRISSKNASFNKCIKKIIARLEFTKSISMHCARHTFATLSLDMGTPIQVTSKLLGHKNIKETQIYANILGNQKDSAMDAFNSL